ncbi:MAG: hypothetical protein KGP28_12615 [Bdellovibrionales bacterium]|nr:hypothetical protein [Bdellovibrionales bacterium]
MHFPFNHAHLCALLLIVSACSRPPNLQKGESASDAQSGQAFPDQVTLSGSLSKELQEIYKHPRLDPCDSSQREIKKLLVTALEENEEKVNDYPSTSSEESSAAGKPVTQAKLVEFQGSYLIHLPKIHSDSAGWSTDLQGWGILHDFFKQNADNPTPQFWRIINENVRSLLLEDKTRVINETNRGIDHANVLHLPRIHSEVESCFQNPGCEAPNFDSALSLAVKSIPLYRFFDQALRSRSSLDSKREILEPFLKRIKRDYSEHSFRKNPLLRVEKSEKGTILNLAMDPGLLGQAEKEIIGSIIESVWSNEKTQVKLEWGSKRQTPDLFEILFHPNSPGARPNVKPYEKVMNLFPGNRTRSVAHEFGHVLGFSDHYYTVWDPDRCLYIYETNDLDLMSNSASGDVTPEEWQTLLNLEEIPAS